jgi:hypothetical protein
MVGSFVVNFSHVINFLFLSLKFIVGIKPKQISVSKKSTRSSSGFVAFNTLDEAVHGLVLCNHELVYEQYVRNPYVFKLTFSWDGKSPANSIATSAGN